MPPWLSGFKSCNPISDLCLVCARSSKARAVPRNGILLRTSYFNLCCYITGGLLYIEDDIFDAETMVLREL
jgi:hypothetical protein